jgi:hypothetical protein
VAQENPTRAVGATTDTNSGHSVSRSPTCTSSPTASRSGARFGTWCACRVRTRLIAAPSSGIQAAPKLGLPGFSVVLGRTERPNYFSM